MHSNQASAAATCLLSRAGAVPSARAATSDRRLARPKEGLVGGWSPVGASPAPEGWCTRRHPRQQTSCVPACLSAALRPCRLPSTSRLARAAPSPISSHAALRSATSPWTDLMAPCSRSDTWGGKDGRAAAAAASSGLRCLCCAGARGSLALFSLAKLSTHPPHNASTHPPTRPPSLPALSPSCAPCPSSLAGRKTAPALPAATAHPPRCTG